jgi:membrane-associated phospholipid phosphatase
MKKQKTIFFQPCVLNYSTRFIVGFCFFLFFVSSLSAQNNNADIRILRAINHVERPALDKSMKFTSATVAPLSIAVPVGVLAYNLAAKKDKPFLYPLAIGGAIAFNAGLTFGMKKAVNRPRPFVTYNDITQRDMHVGPYSFPSGHTSTAFALATSVSLAYPKWYIIAPSFIWAATVGYSRMRLGVHYPSDVLAGAIIGTICGFASWQLTNYVMKAQ